MNELDGQFQDVVDAIKAYSTEFIFKVDKLHPITKVRMDETETQIYMTPPTIPMSYDSANIQNEDYLMSYALPDVDLKVEDTIYYKGVAYRIMSKVEYHTGLELVAVGYRMARQ